jgi:hypothetical protein
VGLPVLGREASALHAWGVEVVRLRPRRLGWPYSVWTLARLADYMVDRTGIRMEAELGRVYLQEAESVLILQCDIALLHTHHTWRVE